MDELLWGMTVGPIEGRCPCMCGDCLCTCSWVPWSDDDSYGQRETVHVDRRNGHTSALSGPGHATMMDLTEIHY